MNQNAVLKRGIEYHTQGQLDQARVDYSQVIDSAADNDVLSQDRSVGVTIRFCSACRT